MSATNNVSIAQLPQLSPENFNSWKFRIRCILEERQLLSTLENSEDKKLDEPAKSLIVQSSTDWHLDFIKDTKTAKEMFEILNNMFERKSIFSRLHLRKKLITLKLHDNEKVEEYFLKFENIVRELETAEKRLDDEEKITYILLGLSDIQRYKVTALETLSKLTQGS